MDKRSRLPIYLGLGTISASALAWQVALTRILSIAEWYHFAFMIVSIALLGYGISGSLLASRAWLRAGEPARILPIFAILFSLSALFSFFVFNSLPFDSFLIAAEPRQFLYLILIYISLTVPFIFSGLCVGWAISRFPREVGKIYFSSLSGSGAGCFLILAALQKIPPGYSPFLIFSLGLLSSCFFYLPRSRRLSFYFLFLTAITVFSIVFGYKRPLIRISPYKTISQALRYPEAEILNTSWNSYSCVQTIRSDMVKSAPGLSLAFTGELPEQRGITIDGENLTSVTRFSGNPDELRFTAFLPGTAAYLLSPRKNVLIIRPRGGLEVLTAVHQKAALITVVEDNKLIIGNLKEILRDFSGNIYNRENVRLKYETPRTFLKRARGAYDVIRIPLTDSFSAVTAGAYGLHADYRYTVEAIDDCLNALSDDGILCVTRWLQTPPSESLKAASAIIESLRKNGCAEPDKHLLAFRGWRTATYLVKKREFTAGDVSLLKEFCDSRKFDLAHVPGIKQEDVNRFNVLPEPYLFLNLSLLLKEKDARELQRLYKYDIRPATDDRPFFFHFFRWKQLGEVIRKTGKEFQPFGGAGFLVLPAFLLTAVIFSILLILAPLLRGQRGTVFGGKPGTNFLISLYFFLIGTGYLFVEIALIHIFIIFLGHPVYSVALILGSILFFSGLGSLASRKTEEMKLTRAALFLPAVVITSYPLIINAGKHILTHPPVPRIIESLLLTVPAAFLLGFPFPAGIRLANKLRKELVPWLWGINGCASVISAIAAMIIAVFWGFSRLMLLAGIAYFGAFLIFLFLSRRE